MNPRRVSWSEHAISVHRRQGVDRATGTGLWVDTLVDHEGMPAAVVVCDDHRVITVRLLEIKDEE